MTDMIVDANSLFARSWFAAQRIEPDPAQAIRLAVNTILLLLNPDTNRIGSNFDRLLFCWDGAQKPDKGRSEKPAEYHPTKDILKEVFTAMLGAAHAEHPHYEGDDLVATAVGKSKADRIYIVSGDKDLMQLQTASHIFYYCLNTKAVLSTAFINQKWYIKRPSQVAIALAIIGDPVDNIEGVRGWGPKKVQKLFADITPDMDFSTVLEAIDEKIPEDLKPAFYESLEKTILNFDVPGVPEPAPIVWASRQEIADIGLPNIENVYRDCYHVYNVEPF